MPDAQAPTQGALALKEIVTLTVTVTRALYLVPTPAETKPAKPDPEPDCNCIVCPNCDGLTMYYGEGCSVCGTVDVR